LGQRIGYFAPLIRAAQGAPDGRVLGVKSTIGPDGSTQFMGGLAVPGNNDFVKYLVANGYNPIVGAPVFEGMTMDYENPNTPPYAFTVSIDTLNNLKNPLTRADILPVADYSHQIETINLTVNDYPPDSVLVVLEISYPGWVVTVNGEPATL